MGSVWRDIFIICKENSYRPKYKPESRSMQNIVGSVGDSICFVKCINRGTGKMRTQIYWNSDT